MLQTRDLLKKSILDTSGSNLQQTAPSKNFNQKFPEQKDSPKSQQIPLPDMGTKMNLANIPRKSHTPQVRVNSPTIPENDVEATINDKIQNKIKELMSNGRSSPNSKNQENSVNLSNKSRLSPNFLN